MFHSQFVSISRAFWPMDMNTMNSIPNKIIRVALQNKDYDNEQLHSSLRLRRKSKYDFRRKKSKVLMFDGHENITSNTGKLFCHIMETILSPFYTSRPSIRE
ncbi:MULE domain-containing protein, partial [Aphis craccivora]